MNDLHPLLVSGLMIAVATIIAVPLFLDRRPPRRRKVLGSPPVIPDLTGGPITSQSRGTGRVPGGRLLVNSPDGRYRIEIEDPTPAEIADAARLCCWEVPNV